MVQKYEVIRRDQSTVGRTEKVVAKISRYWPAVIYATFREFVSSKPGHFYIVRLTKDKQKG